MRRRLSATTPCYILCIGSTTCASSCCMPSPSPRGTPPCRMLRTSPYSFLSVPGSLCLSPSCLKLYHSSRFSRTFYNSLTSNLLFFLLLLQIQQHHPTTQQEDQRPVQKLAPLRPFSFSDVAFRKEQQQRMRKGKGTLETDRNVSKTRPALLGYQGDPPNLPLWSSISSKALSTFYFCLDVTPGRAA